MSGCLRRYRTAFLRRVFGVAEGVKGEEGAVGLGGVVGRGGALDLAEGSGIVGRKEVLIRPKRILRRLSIVK